MKVRIEHNDMVYELFKPNVEELFKKGEKEMECCINRVKGYRCMLGMSQLEFSSAVNIPDSTYRYKEQGKSQFTMDELKRIKDLLISKGITVSIDDLI